MKIVILIILAGLMFGCNENDKSPPETEILVEIGPDYITKDELNKELDKLSYKQKSIYTSSPEKLNEYLQTQINEKVLYNEALRRGIQNREEIQNDLENYERKLIAKTLGKELLQELELSQEEIKEYYDENKRDYERIDISKIFVRLDMKEENPKDSALKKAALIVERAKSGESFEELAIEFSDDPVSKKKSGKAGYLNRGRFSQDMDEIIFTLNKGDITKPFEVDGGYLIIKANKEVELPPYGQVERNIRSKLINQRFLNYINSLRKEWKVRVYEDRLEEISKSVSNQK